MASLLAVAGICTSVGGSLSSSVLQTRSSFAVAGICTSVGGSLSSSVLQTRSSFAVAGICTSVGESLSSSLLQYRSSSDEGLDGCVPTIRSTADPLLGEFSPAAPNTQTFGADTPNRNAYPLGKREGLRVCGTPRVVRTLRLTRTVLSEEERPVLTSTRASRNFTEESWHETYRVRMKLTVLNEDGNMAHGLWHDSPRRGFVSGKELPVVSACGPGNLHLSSATTTSEAIAILKHRQKRGLSIDSYMFVDILKRCSRQKDLTATRQVHDYIYQSGMQKHHYVANTLLSVYVKCDRLQDARRVFDGLERTNRDVITWNVMIGGYAKNGCGVEAYRLFLRMEREGFVADAFTYASILNPSASAGALEWVREVHHHARQGGLESNWRVGNALVHMYAKSGSIYDARIVFDRVEERGVITWNIMIGAYAESGCGMEAYRLFLQMKREGFVADAFTYASILNPSASAGALEWVREVHGHARKAGLESNLRVGNALVHMYAKSGSIADARIVFDRMEERDVITWNIMIGAYAESGCGMEAYRLFVQMKREGFVADAVTYASILNASASAGALEWVREVHSDAHKAGLESNLRVGNALVHMYAKSGSIYDARIVFDRLEERDKITWNIMIGAYAESGCGMEAYRLFVQMKREGFVADAVTYASILNASARAGALEWVREVHSDAHKAGLESNLRVGNALVHMYAKSGSIDDARIVFDRMEKRNVITWTIMIRAYAESGSIDDARRVFDRMEERDVITWTIMIGAYAESGCGMEAYQLFLQMKREGFVADAVTYASILNASASAGALEWVRDVHGHARRAGLESELDVGTALVHMYAKSGSIDDARLVFDRMDERDVVTWAAMIGGLGLHGCGDEALKLFEKMIADCVQPDGTLFVAVLSACCHAGRVDDGRRLFLAMKQDYGIVPTIVHYTCMVDLLGRAGQLEEAKLLIDNMPVEPEPVTWRALLGACRTYCNVELGELVAKEALKLDPKNAAVYVLLSNIYAAAGKWEKVGLVRSLMQERGVRKEAGRSWIEVDNKIHEFVVGDTSHPEAKAIYSLLQELTERLKARGYIPDTNLVLQNIHEEDKDLALCSHSEKLAIAYGLLHVPFGKSIHVQKNLRVCLDCHAATKLISEVTAREIIVRDANRFHHFKDGVCSCGDYW